MKDVQFLRIKKLIGKDIVRAAARHNLREIAAEIGADGHIDPMSIADNVVLCGPNVADDVACLARTLMNEAGVKKLRADAVRGLEIIFSLAPDTVVDQCQFFADSTCWAKEYFNVPVLSATIHNDEDAPHCHLLLLPLVNGRMIGSDLMGYKARLQAMQTSFHEKVGRAHGLIRQTPQKRHSAAVRTTAIDIAFHALEANSGLKTAVLRTLLQPHFKNPEPLMSALNLSMPILKSRNPSFVKIMTKPCKSKKPIGFYDENPMGVQVAGMAKNDQTLCSVGFDNFGVLIHPQTGSQRDSTARTENRGDKASARESSCEHEHADEQWDSCWDENLGGFVHQTLKASRK